MASTSINNGQHLSQAQLPQNLTCPDLTQSWLTDVSRAAVAYCRMGWPVTVLCPPNHFGEGAGHCEGCGSPGKCPVHGWQRCFRGQPLSQAEILELYRRNPRRNVGAATGVLFTRTDVEGPTGEHKLQEVSRGDLPETLEFTSGRGRGILYGVPPGVTLRTTAEPLAIGEELRLQGLGAQTVLPPSVHANGSTYRWVAGRGPCDRPLAPMPAWMLERMRPDADRGLFDRRPGVAAPPCPGDDGPIYHGRRDAVLTSLAGTMRRRRYFSTQAIYAALVEVNARLCRPPLPDAQVQKIARSIGRRPPDLMGVEIIADYFTALYKPEFKRGTAIILPDGSEVTQATACTAIASDVIPLLMRATDAPLTKDRKRVNRGALPGFCKKWAPFGWNDYLLGVPTADQREDIAGVDFTRMVRDALLSELTIGRRRRRRGEPVEQWREQNSVIGWCQRFARPGPWRQIRDKQCWCRRTQRDGGELALDVAFTHALLSQVKADRRLIAMNPRTFYLTMATFNLGRTSEAERPHGHRAIVLSDTFCSELLYTPQQDEIMQ